MKFGLGICLLAMAKAALAQPMKLRDAEMLPLTFAELNGWSSDDQSAAFAAYLKSCGAILNGTKAMRKARPVYGGLYTACENATALNATSLAAGGAVDTATARKFFEDNFSPVRIKPPERKYGFYTGADGFYTGYYEPEVMGSRVKTEEYSVPLYGVPAKVAGKKSTHFAQFDRVDIENGALNGKGLEICWVKNPVDAFFAQIQGSTRVKLDDGELLRLNYIASNGKPYTPVGRVLIERGIITAEEMTMDKIREFMEGNPEEGKALREKNRSFVFFSKTKLQAQDECLGAQGIALTPGRSIAVDPGIHVYGTPVWIDAKFPLKSATPDDSFQRLMVAQDTGSAIRGPARADIYFGHGPEIPSIAGRIKQFGQFVMLMPRMAAAAGEVNAKSVPLPKPRPKNIVAAAN
jgi:membrane-bound lytic murein transglycosylase A